MKNKRYAIIGGSGFIGTRLVKRLMKETNSVAILDKVASTSFPEISSLIDVCSTSSLERELTSSDVIVNLAAEHRDDVSPISRYYEVNVEGAKNVCNVAREKGIQKIIFTSSVAVYGFPPPWYE